MKGRDDQKMRGKAQKEGKMLRMSTLEETHRERGGVCKGGTSVKLGMKSMKVTIKQHKISQKII